MGDRLGPEYAVVGLDGFHQIQVAHRPRAPSSLPVTPPRADHVHNNLGVIYSERQDFGQAAREYEAALDLDRRLAATYYNWGNDLLRQGMHRRAIRRFSKSLRIYSTDVWALNNRGLAYLKIAKVENARKDFKAALRIEPGFEQARKSLQSLR